MSLLGVLPENPVNACPKAGVWSWKHIKHSVPSKDTSWRKFLFSQVKCWGALYPVPCYGCDVAAAIQYVDLRCCRCCPSSSSFIVVLCCVGTIAVHCVGPVILHMCFCFLLTSFAMLCTLLTSLAHLQVDCYSTWIRAKTIYTNTFIFCCIMYSW